MTRLTALFILSLLSAATALADDWPQWRGPQRDGVWRETGIMETIPATGFAIRWRAKVGRGYSGPVVAQGRVYVSDQALDPEVERVLCFDEATGRQLWAHSSPSNYQNMDYGNGPRATPTVEDGKVFTLGTKGHLLCLDAADGKVIWQKNLVKDFNGRIPQYGASAAPLVVGDLLIVLAGGEPDGSVVALDKKTGDLRWKALGDRPAYSAPIVITAGGCQQLIVWSADSITSFDPGTGKVHWQVPWKETFDPTQMMASPVWYKDMLLFMSTWNRGSKMLKLDPTKPSASVLWETSSKPATLFTTPLFQDDGHFYAVLGNGRLACLEAATGKEVWSNRAAIGKGEGTASLTRNGDQVFLFNSGGHLILDRLTPKGYQELGRALLVEPTAGYRAQGPSTWSHPAYANKCVFARNDRELVCASLALGQGVEMTAPERPIKSRLLAGIKEDDGAAALAFSPDGTKIVVGRSLSPDGTRRAVGEGNWMQYVTVLDLATSKTLPSPEPQNHFLSAVAYSPDGRLLVYVGGSDWGKSAQVKLWDAVAGKDLGELTGHTLNVYSAAFSPDSKTLATGSDDKSVRLWDMATRKQRAVLKGHLDAVWSVAFSPDGKILASASADGTLKLWDADTGKERGDLKGHQAEVRAVAFSPDGKTMASGSADWTVRLWDVATQKERAVLKGHRGGIICLAFSSDGKTLATGSGDETVKLWDPATGKERATLQGHRGGISAIAFSLDNRTLASAVMDDAVRLWDLTPDK